MSSIRVLLAPDKFKGSLSASEVAHGLETGLTGSNPETISCRSLPLADGGDGSVQAGFKPFTMPVTGPTGTPVTTTIAFNGSVAVIEVATTSGLQMLPPGQPAPLASSSVGFGQAVRAALDHGPKQIVLALGGSATTDGGAGLLSALGPVWPSTYRHSAQKTRMTCAGRCGPAST